MIKMYILSQMIQIALLSFSKLIFNVHTIDKFHSHIFIQ